MPATIFLRTALGPRVFRLPGGGFLRFPIPGTPPTFANTAQPTLTGDPLVGATLTIGAGTWTGSPTIVRDLMKNNAVLVSNVGSTYVVQTTDDVSTLFVREIPNGQLNAGVVSASKSITYTPPTAGAGIPDQVKTQGTGIQTVDAAAIFTGSNLTWSIVAGPTGVDVNSGVVSMPTVDIQSGVSVTVRASNSGGSVDDTFLLTVNPVAPALSGTAISDQSYQQNTGTKTVDTAIGFTGQGLTYSLVSPPAGVTIASSTGVVSIVTTSLLASAVVTVRATNVTDDVDLTFDVEVLAAAGTPPLRNGAVSTVDQVGLIRGSGSSTQSPVSWFNGGAATSWEVTGVGVTIHVTTGLLTFAKTATVPLQTVTVKAINADGNATATFQMSCIMGVIDLDDVVLTIRTDPTGDAGVPVDAATWMFELTAPPPGVASLAAVTRVWWRGDAHVAGQVPGAGYYPCKPHPTLPNIWIARTYTSASDPTPIWAAFLHANHPTTGRIGDEVTHHLMYTTDALGTGAYAAEFSGPSAALVQVLQLFVEEPPVGTRLSSIVPLTSVDEWNTAGYVCGDGGQLILCGDYCRDFPDVCYIGGDSHSIWKSEDFCLTWRRPTRLGLFAQNSCGVAVDPVDPDRVFCYMGNAFSPGSGGLYLSVDGAESFQTRKVDTVSLASNAGNLLGMGYAPGSISGGRANKWFAVMSSSANTNTVTAKSTDGGATWTIISTGAWGTGRGKPSACVGDPTDDDVFWMSSTTGLYRVDNAFSGTPTYTQHRSVAALARAYVSPNGQTVKIAGGGIWMSTNAHAAPGSITFAQQGSFTNFNKAFIHPVDSNFIITFAVYTPQNVPFRSVNGTTFTQLTTSAFQVRPGTAVSNTNPSVCQVSNNHMMFDPSNVNRVAFTGRNASGPTANNHFRSTNKGANWTLANEGYNGSNVKMFTPSPAMFDISDKNRIFFPHYDIGAWYTANGCKYFPRPNNDNMRDTRNLLPGYTGADGTGVTCIGSAIHPNVNVWLAAAGDYQNVCGIIRSTDNVTWAVPGNSVSAKTGGFFYNYSSPGNIMWFNRRSVDGNWATWSGVMSGLDATDCVGAHTTKLSGTNYFFATNRFSTGNTVLKRSGDNGASWQSVLTLDYAPKTNLGFASFACDPFDENVVYFQDKSPFRYRIRKYNLVDDTFVTLNLFGASGAAQPGAYTKPIIICIIAVDPRFADVMYCTSDPVGQSNLWRTEDGGATWEDMDGTCEIGLGRNSLMVHPLTGDVFTGSDQGLHVIPPPYAQAGTLFEALPYDSYVGPAP